MREAARAAAGAVSGTAKQKKRATAIAEDLVDLIEGLNAAGVFSGGIEFASEANFASAAQVWPSGKVTFHLGHLAETQGVGRAYLAGVVTEEVIHVAAKRAITGEQAEALWRSLPESLQKVVREAYDGHRVADGKDPLPRTDYVMGHEFLRMVVQDRAFRGLVTEAMDAEAAWTGQVLEFLQRLVDTLRQMVRGLPEDSQARTLVDDAVARTTAALWALKVRFDETTAPPAAPAAEAKETPPTAESTPEARADEIVEAILGEPETAGAAPAESSPSPAVSPPVSGASAAGGEQPAPPKKKRAPRKPKAAPTAPPVGTEPNFQPPMTEGQRLMADAFEGLFAAMRRAALSETDARKLANLKAIRARLGQSDRETAKLDARIAEIERAAGLALSAGARPSDDSVAAYMEEAGKPFESLPPARQRELLAEAERQIAEETDRLRREGRIDALDQGGEVRAPNGKASRLYETLADEVQDPAAALRLYAMVHTPFFKRWFGDWEGLNQSQILKGPEIASVALDSIRARAGEKASDAARRWLSENPQSNLTRPGFGPVVFDGKSIKDTLGHGFSGPKLSALTAVPEVIRRGVVLNSEMDFSGKPIRNWILAAPVNVNGERHTLFVRLRRDEAEPLAKFRFYVHEVVLESAIKDEPGAFQTGADPAESGGKRTGGTGFMVSLARAALSVNPDSVSRAVDSNGEPLVLWHSRLQPFEAFKKYGKFMGVSGVAGIHLTDSREMAARYLDRFAEYGWVDGRPNQPFQKEIVPLFARVTRPLYRQEPFPTQLRLGAPIPAGYVSPVERMGYDALIRDEAISRTGGVKHASARNAIRGREIVLFDPNGVKLATGNQGTFSGSDRILSAGARPTAIPQDGLPADRLGKFVAAAQALIAEGVRTPAALAAQMDILAPNGALRRYSQAFWDAFGMVDPTLRGTHDWDAVYAGEEEQAEEPAAEAEAAPATPAAEAASVETPAEAAEEVKEHLDTTTEQSGPLTAQGVKTELLRRIDAALAELPAVEFAPDKEMGIWTWKVEDEIFTLRRSKAKRKKAAYVLTTTRPGVSPKPVAAESDAQAVAAALEIVSDRTSEPGAAPLRIEIPGDGTFTIQRTMIALNQVRDRVARMRIKEAPDTAPGRAFQATIDDAVAAVEKPSQIDGWAVQEANGIEFATQVLDGVAERKPSERKLVEAARARAKARMAGEAQPASESSAKDIDEPAGLRYVGGDERPADRPRSASQDALGELHARHAADPGGEDGTDVAEWLRAEAESLYLWASEAGWLLDPAALSGEIGRLRRIGGATEHDVYAPEDKERVIKITIPPAFGARGSVGSYVAGC